MTRATNFKGRVQRGRLDFRQAARKIVSNVNSESGEVTVFHKLFHDMKGNVDVLHAALKDEIAQEGDAGVVTCMDGSR